MVRIVLPSIIALWLSVGRASAALSADSIPNPLNLTTAFPFNTPSAFPHNLTDIGLPLSPEHVVYHDTPDERNFCRFIRGPLLRQSRLIPNRELMPMITELQHWALSIVVMDPYEPIEDTIIGHRTPAWNTQSQVGSTALRIQNPPGSGISPYGLSFCLSKLSVWAHTYSFPPSSFEIWTQAHNGPLQMEGMGYVFYRRPERQGRRGGGGPRNLE